MPDSAAPRGLNVTDALSYLDAVKREFSDTIDVYNQFLDIMKDFKSQKIETPGVIQRVSRLFHGNPSLIQGFNTFLPTGYRIEVSADPADPNTITVTTPSGTTTQNTASGMPVARPPRDQPQSTPAPGLFPTQPPAPPLAPHLQGQINGPGSRSLTPHAFQLPHGPGQPPFEPMLSPGIPNQSTAASYLNNLNPGERQQPEGGEFNHAIQYLNKIKARYTDEPSVYKQFLDILQTYQKEQRMVQDTHVYTQVETLFKDSPDLLAEFKDFLPDAIGGGVAMHPNGLPMMAQPMAPGWPQGDTSPPMASRKGLQTKRRKTKFPEKEPTPVPPSKGVPSRSSKKIKHHHNPDEAGYSPYIDAHSPPTAYAYPPTGPGIPPPPGHLPPHHPAAYMGGPSGPGMPMGMMPGVEYTQPGGPGVPPGAVLASSSNPNLSNALGVMGGPNSSSSANTNGASNPFAGKLLFFDRAKKSLENREVYDDFLKLLGMYSKDVIDTGMLVERAKAFLGEGGELITEFADLIGWEDKTIEHRGPPGSIRTAPPENPPALPVEDGDGPSYRRLMPNETKLACSGRDELCRSVLNDDWVSHPTWASEEAGFIAHKKTQYEDIQYKIEEERHEFHVAVEALLRTIAVLEPIHLRIEEMTNEERSYFKLKPDFGGPSPSIYHRVIRRVYGKDVGKEVIEALQECPSVAVPVVLGRLKSKDEEWRRAQREHSRLWKEIDFANYYKALDMQGINFKPNDKKNITSRHFVNEIETIKSKQMKRFEGRGFKKFSHGGVGHQLEFEFGNEEVLKDSLKMVFGFLDHAQGQYSSMERRAVEKFLNAFVPLIILQHGQQKEKDKEDTAMAIDEAQDGGGGGTASAGTKSAGGGRKSVGSPSGSGSAAASGGVPANDLRKKLLKTAQEKASSSSAGAASGKKAASTSASNVASRAASPSPGSPRMSVRHASGGGPAGGSKGSGGDLEPDVWIREAGFASQQQQQGENPTSPERERLLFVNTTFYTLVRLLEVLYSRLLMAHEIGAEYARQKHAPLLANRVAVELGLDDPNGPPVVLAQYEEALGNSIPSDANIVYMYLLSACDKLFDNEMDQGTFEEHMRWFFGTKAYLLFTLDKLIMALVKQVQTILGDHKCQEVWSLAKTAAGSRNVSSQDVIRYRREAERHVGQDDHLYLLQWVGGAGLRISLYEAGDATAQMDRSRLARWQEYVASYVLRSPTEWVPKAERGRRGVFLARNLGTQRTATRGDGGICVRISMPMYRLVYEAGGEESVWNPMVCRTLAERARVRGEERGKSSMLR